MAAENLNLPKYIAEVKKNLNLAASDELIEKDLLLTLILAEFEKSGLGKNLIFKGGTLLARNYLSYHRFSEDLDFVHKDSIELRTLSRKAREKRIKQFIDNFVPELKKIADMLHLIFSLDRSDTKFCSIFPGRVVYIFRMYYTTHQFIKIEINFVEKMIYPPKMTSVKAITDLFDAKEMLFVLGLTINNFKVLSYPLEEIILEKYRALLTRKTFKERDLFDLFLIRCSLQVTIEEVVEKIRSSSLIKKQLEKTLTEKLELLEKNTFFISDEKIEDLTIIKYNKQEFEEFRRNIKNILLKICQLFIKETQT